MSLLAGAWGRGVRVGFGLVALVAVACGGSDDDGGSGSGSNTLGSGVDGSKKVADLSAAEAQQFCDAYGAKSEAVFDSDSVKRGGCTLFGFLGAQDVASCESNVTECLKSADQTPVEATTTCETDPAKRAGCDATVAELDACFADTLPLMKQFYDSITCKNLLGGSSSSFSTPATPASCTKLQTRCPQMFTDDTSGP